VSARNSAFRAASWRIEDTVAYAYLLGCYLGDGYLLHRPPHSWTLRISCDPQYPSPEYEIASAMTAVFPDAAPRCHQPTGSSVDVPGISHPAIGRAFPQHGRGPKHLRPIELDWQREITTAHPGELVRGLIHSDGCRTINRFSTRLPSGRVAEYAYVRYFFSKLSADIRQIFRDPCELLGIRVTQSNLRNLSVSHRTSVAILEHVSGRSHDGQRAAVDLLSRPQCEVR
jgi:hypothetical protein